jgi:hypothetical protein
MALKAFLSYAREDRELVERYFDALARSGYTPWMDCRMILPGQNWEAEIEHALTSANVVLAFLSRSSVTKRGFVQREVNFALDRLKYKLPTDIYLIPLLLEQCDVPSHVSSRLQYIDLSINGAWEQVLASLNLAAEQQQIAAVDGVRFGPFSVVTRKFEGVEAGRIKSVEYPVFSSVLRHREAEQLTNFFSRRVEGNAGNEDQSEETEAQATEDDEWEPDQYWESFDLTHATQRLVSISVTMSYYFAGAAHPSHGIETFNFILDSGVRRLQLSDVFEDIGAAEERISEISRDRLLRNLWEITGEEPDQHVLDWIEAGSAPHAGNFDNFLLMSDILTVTFSPYQVGPYAIGFQSVEIPYYDLRRLLRPAGPHTFAQSSGDA